MPNVSLVKSYIVKVWLLNEFTVGRILNGVSQSNGSYRLKWNTTRMAWIENYCLMSKKFHFTDQK